MQEGKSKMDKPSDEEKALLRININKMTYQDRISIVNEILSKVGEMRLFVYEKPNPHVAKAAQDLIDNWLESNFKNLQDEYKSFMKEKNLQEKQKDAWKETAKKPVNVDDGMEQVLQGFQKHAIQSNYHDTFSDDDDFSSESTWEITEYYINGVRFTGEVNSDDEDDVEHDDSSEKV